MALLAQRRSLILGLLLLLCPFAEAETTSTFLNQYSTNTDIAAAFAALETTHPDFCRRISIGTSTKGRELWALRITDNPDAEEDEPEIKWVGGIHGDELVGTQLLLCLAELLLANASDGPTGTAPNPILRDLVHETDLWLLPLMNPDGAEALTGPQRANINGVDLNRSFPEHTLTPLGTIFDTPLAPSLADREAETRAVMEWSAAHRFVLSGVLHSGALLVNYPYDNDGLGSVDSPTPDDALFEFISREYSRLNPPMWNSPFFPDGISNGADWFAINGGSQDWNYRYLGCNELTIEVSRVKLPAASTLPTFWNENRESMLALTQTARLGIRGLVTDCAGAPLSARITVAGNPQPVFSDPDVGDFHRMLLPGTYDLTVEADGHLPKTVRGVTVGDGLAIRVDVTLPALAALPGTAPFPITGIRREGNGIVLTWDSCSSDAPHTIEAAPSPDGPFEVVASGVFDSQWIEPNPTRQATYRVIREPRLFSK